MWVEKLVKGSKNINVPVRMRVYCSLNICFFLDVCVCMERTYESDLNTLDYALATETLTYKSQAMM